MGTSVRQRVVCVAIVAVAATVLLTPSAGAQDGPQRVEVGAYLLDVSHLDIAEGTYTANLLLQFRCDGRCRVSPKNFELENGRARMSRLENDRPDFLVYHVIAELHTSFDLRRYPFEELRLPIEIEDALATDRDLVYVATDELSGIDPEANVAGRRLVQDSVTVDAHNYPVFDETYSRFVFTAVLRKPVLTPILQAILPAFIIIVTGLLALGLGVEHIADRLIATTSALVAAVLFHLYLADALPPLGYLTFADRYMIINYLVLAMAVAATAIAMILHRRGDDARIARLDRLVLVGGTVLWLGLHAVNAVAVF